MNIAATASTASTGRKGLNLGLWVAQAVFALIYGGLGFMKLTAPVAKLVDMQIKWAGDVPVAFVRTIAVLEILGAIGLILPAALRIQPKLTVAAAACFTVLQVLAIGFHASRGETSQTIGLNIVLIALSIFILWGRSKKAAIVPR